jgi:hypothetical protein
VDFLHSEVSVRPGQAVVIELDRAANVRVMDGSNFERYRRGDAYRFFGGPARRSPVAIRPPSGRWHVVIDLGGGAGRLSANVRVQ